ncbi:mediator of RNA polymerase II transcription subunit 15a-like isoform X1 [Prosopis cineraria]|uniref:mediator of RNA polymerase II transcription subunit 15a-like isoform X1 n=1 Tax=Prosopis cineraria TaxID=364024 RepID=UPI0024109ABC|nr:mediator of RNA polymerase II transcription subunit 15a-like isoform X1 [Prosopis cineraria]
MDTNNWGPSQGTEPTMDTNDWRAQLQPESRQRNVNKMNPFLFIKLIIATMIIRMETLKRHLPCSGEEGIRELRMIAQRFEEKIYTAATSQPDYLRKISLKMLTMENKSQNNINNPMPSNPGGPSNQPPDKGI